MSSNSVTNITPEEIYGAIDRLLHDTSLSAAEVGRRLHALLELVCEAGTKDSCEPLGNLLSKVDYLCKRFRLRPADCQAIQLMRRHSSRPESMLPEDVPHDCRALALLAASVFNAPAPQPMESKPSPPPTTPRQWSCLRCIVEQVDGRHFSAITDDKAPALITVDYGAPRYDHLVTLLQPGMQLNLIDARQPEGRSDIEVQLIVVEPDFLIDISSLARCFTEMGHHPLSYVYNSLQPNIPSQATILGNFAGSALKDIVNAQQDYRWTDTLKDNFRSRAIDFCTCKDFDGATFKADAERQASNIQGIVDDLFGEQLSAYERSKAILEPSFICEQLGLQGRADLMTTDLTLLVEQKSGKNFNIQRAFRNILGYYQKEDHYVQLLLYFGVLCRNFGVDAQGIKAMLLYSKYPLNPKPGGLIPVDFDASLFHEAIGFRNRVVATLFQIARQGFGSVIDDIRPSTLNEAHSNSRLVQQYLLPRVQHTADLFSSLSPLTRAYFCTMVTFSYREQVASRIGSHQGFSQSFADFWNLPLNEKKEQGCIFTDMQLESCERDDGAEGYSRLRFSIPPQSDDFLPNFRPGDPVYVYAYVQGTVPDVRRSLLLKATLIGFTATTLTVHLNDSQGDARIFDQLCTPPSGSTYVFALEHADYGGGAELRGLFEMVSAPSDRLNLLLGQRVPRQDPHRTLTKTYNPSYDPIVLKAKQALDYFLLVGPPGAGKTSMALRFIVEEALATPGTGGEPPSLLLMAYTNRAVDEICGMLEDAHIDYLRIGNEYMCDERYRVRMLSRVIGDKPRLDSIRALITGTQVIVGTTLSIQSQQGLLGVKHFHLAVVDEAGQILEPGLVGLLASHRSGQCDIDKFILMGDYKQLPAVVQQSASGARVDDALLRDIGIDDCRRSLFERLINWERHCHRSAFVGTLHKQGRMHPEIAAFPCHMFYPQEQMECVPLPHQLQQTLPYTLPSADSTDDHLKRHRVIFIPSEADTSGSESDKVNASEARIVADLLRRIHRFYGARFSPHATVGVIVPYRNQIAMIRKAIEKLDIPALRDISIDTVERYQGSQRDVIIYSFTITHRYQLDFLTANSMAEEGREVDRKLNVALTRARCQLILTGHEPTLRFNSLFARLLDDVKARGGWLRYQ